jgi:hypothetical protein
MQMKESKFGAPEGVYVAKFLGVAPMRNENGPRLGRDGRPMEPGVEWQFEVLEGEQKGQLVGRITSAAPTSKNSCGELLKGIIGRIPSFDEVVDLGAYVGQTFTVVIGASKESPDKTHVQKILRLTTPLRQGQPAAPTAPQGSAPRPPAPPSPPKPPAPPAPPKPTAPSAANGSHAARRFWVQTNPEAEPVLLEEHEVQTFVTGQGVDPAALPCMPEDQAGGWKTAKDLGIVIPF